MSFQMMYRPTSIVFMDDDVDYLEMVRMTFPQAWSVELFSRQSACIERLQHDALAWEQDAQMHQNLVEVWRKQEKSLLLQVLTQWGHLMNTSALSGLCFVDYAMPGIDGLQLLAQIKGWPGGRVLLTGQADEHLAIQAFNQGLIQQYVPKQDSQVRGRLLALAENSRRTSRARYEQIWLSTLNSEQYQILYQESVQDLKQWAQERWTRYICMGEPFGVLGQTPEGHLQWLQLETQDRLEELAQLLETDQATSEQREAVRKGVLLPDLDLRLHLAGSDPVRFSNTHCWGAGSGTVYGACFDLQTSR